MKYGFEVRQRGLWLLISGYLLHGAKNDKLVQLHDGRGCLFWLSFSSKFQPVSSTYFLDVLLLILFWNFFESYFAFER
ncbi:hypothetical protein KFK09_016405 [Dendrobium nobile]|uniref:Uncharacterized protein n=1 Tax=Dendrobium nobile TaxID=94219 RepID=A0A8T3AZD5_DENNO|nr:hypothetical protein KFK09_016405 [Dendrobium nobile]